MNTTTTIAPPSGNLHPSEGFPGAKPGNAASHLAISQPQLEHIPIARIRADGGTQMRAGLNQETVTEYAEWLNDLSYRRNGLLQMPELTVYYDGTDYWLADGFHRLAAWKSLDDLPTAIQAKVNPGDRRAAILHAAGANADHGLRRTNADKRRAVETLLRDGEWQKWSDPVIADKCKVDPKTVNNIRRELISTKEIPKLDTRIGADGKTRDVSNIGRKAETIEQPEYVPYFRLLGAIRAWLSRLTLDHDDPMLALSILRKGGDSAYRQKLEDHLRFAEIVYRESDLPRAVNELYEWERRRQEAGETQAPPPDPAPGHAPGRTPAPPLGAAPPPGASLTRDDAFDAEPRLISTAWPTGNYPLISNGFTLEQTDQGWRYCWANYAHKRFGPLVANREAATELAKAVLAEYQVGKDVMPNGEVRHDHVMSNLIHNPASDINFKIAFDEATVEQLREALEYIPAEGQKVKRERIEARLRKLAQEAAMAAIHGQASKPKPAAPFDALPASPPLPASLRGGRSTLAEQGSGQTPKPQTLLTPPDLAAAGYEIILSSHSLAPASGAAAGDAYRWVNADGEVGDWWSLDACIADARKRIELAPAPTMPADLAAAGYRIVSVGQGMWAWELITEDNLMQGNWHHNPADAIADARADYIEPQPAVTLDVGHDRVLGPFSTFDAWLAAMPVAVDGLGLRECLSVIALAKAAAHRAKIVDADCAGAVHNALPMWSQLIIKLEKLVRR